MGIEQICVNDPLTDDIEFEEPISSELVLQYKICLTHFQKKLFKIFSELSEKSLKADDFNNQYRTQIRGVMLGDKRTSQLLDTCNQMFDEFHRSFLNAPVHNFIRVVTHDNFSISSSTFSAMLCAKILLSMGQTIDRAKFLFIGALLQDIALPSDFYTAEELSSFHEKGLKEHPKLGCMAVNETPQLSPLCGVGILHSHRYINRSGFPKSMLVNSFP